MALSISRPSTPPADLEVIEYQEDKETPKTTRTNTLVITSLPPPFFDPPILEALRSHFALFGEIHTWAPISAFARAILVYYLEEPAEIAKEHCDGLVIGPLPGLPETTIRVYRADPTPIDDDDVNQGEGNRYLKPPEHEKNFLISPPGSPPEGWEQIREDPPNPTPIAHDLIHALQKLHLAQQEKGSIEVLIAPEEGPGIGIYVEDCDGAPEIEVSGAEEQEWFYGQPSARPPWRPCPTALPPMIVGA
ncbi:hypothetical protein NLI96_g3778 [Meripilus lineatus]|uniref:Calcipressin n=1 Tax=Meripilus lineatus TaxID=2056292 RepID=A0AAD5V6C1_9APHY|nr:hypothetical protein NLI96_g3778 [Physisporinus lineatus]